MARWSWKSSEHAGEEEQQCRRQKGNDDRAETAELVGEEKEHVKPGKPRASAVLAGGVSLAKSSQFIGEDRSGAVKRSPAVDCRSVL